MDRLPLSSASVLSGFLNTFIIYSFYSNALIILFCFPQSIGLQNLCDQTPDTSNFFPPSPIFYLSYKFNFSFDAQNLYLFVTVTLLSRYQSHVICRSRNVVGNFTRKINCRYCCHFSGLEFMDVPASVKGLPFQGSGDGRIFIIVYFMENCTGNFSMVHPVVLYQYIII